jgi:hypothetical protein
MRFRNILIVSLGAFLCGWSNGIHLAYSGTTPDMSAEAVSLVFWGESEESRRANGVSTRVEAIHPDTQDKSINDTLGSETSSHNINTEIPRKSIKNLHRFDGAVIQPGQYRVVATCVISLRDSVAWAYFQAAAGKRYQVRCTGRTSHTLKLTVQEI